MDWFSTLSMIFQFISGKATYLFNLIFTKMEDVGLNFPSFISKMITLIILFLLFMLSFKITQKIIKFIIILLILVLIVSILYSMGIDLITTFFKAE